jgi:hypothetical protein
MQLWLSEADMTPTTLNFINCMLGSYNKKLILTSYGVVIVKEAFLIYVLDENYGS